MGKITQELSVRVEDVLDQARRQLRKLAFAVAAELVALGGVIGWAVYDALLPGLGVGAVVGFLATILVLDFGNKLDHRPRGFNLVRARDGATLALALFPLGTWQARRVLRRLSHPVLAKHSVANHPEAKATSSETLLARIRARSAFINVRRASFVYIVLGVLGFLTRPPDSGIALNAFVVTAVILTVGGIVQLIAGFAGSIAMADLSPAREKRALFLSWLCVPWLPFGPLLTLYMVRAARAPTNTRPVTEGVG